jgi:hypothetical protein
LALAAHAVSVAKIESDAQIFRGSIAGASLAQNSSKSDNENALRLRAGEQ